MLKDYSVDVQRLFLEMMLQDAQSYVRVQNIYNPENFDRSLGREVTVVPDQDTAGMKLVDRAVELDWAVSMPAWPQEIKDVNDAVKEYGRLVTLIHIMQARETSRIKIELRKRQFVKRSSQ